MEVWGYIINIRNIRLRSSLPVSVSIFINAFHFRSLRHKVFNSFALFGESEESFYLALVHGRVFLLRPSRVPHSLQLDRLCRMASLKSSYALYCSSSSSFTL